MLMWTLWFFVYPLLALVSVSAVELYVDCESTTADHPPAPSGRGLTCSLAMPSLAAALPLPLLAPPAGAGAAQAMAGPTLPAAPRARARSGR
jgi:hypothetical protein